MIFKEFSSFRRNMEGKYPRVLVVSATLRTYRSTTISWLVIIYNMSVLTPFAIHRYVCICFLHHYGLCDFQSFLILLTFLWALLYMRIVQAWFLRVWAVWFTLPHLTSRTTCSAVWSNDVLSFNFFWRANVAGEIPESLGQLTNLKRLDLNVNQLSGEITRHWLVLEHETLCRRLSQPCLCYSDIRIQVGMFPKLCSLNHPSHVSEGCSL